MKKLSLLLFSLVFVAHSQQGIPQNVDKNVTIISARSSADGSTEMHTEILEQCIESLPIISKLKATVTSKVKYVRAINGKTGNDDHVKMYTAKLTISYIEAQKMLLVLTQESIQAQEPKTEIHNKRVKKVALFVSDSNNGKTFANQSQRIYYFATEDEAVADVKKKAEAWLSQQQAILCGTTSTKTNKQSGDVRQKFLKEGQNPDPISTKR